MKLWQIRKDIMLKTALTAFVLSCFLGRLDCEELTVKQAKNVTLECYGHSDANIMLSWQKPDLQSEYYVFYFSDEHIHKDKQHESFKDRVELKDREIKNGNFSVILKNVTMNDAGKYECYAGYHRQRPQLLKSIDLKVKEDQKIFTAESGQNVTLPCRAPNISVPIRAVEWFRLDQLEGHVLMYREEQFVSFNQLPSFVNRVDLQDRWMKDGDVSLILKDVTRNDTGTYQCYVIQRETNHRKSVVEHISIIYLSVDPAGQTGGHTEDGGKEDGEEKDVGKEAGSVGLNVCHLLLLAAVVAFSVTFKKSKAQQKQNYYKPPAEVVGGAAINSSDHSDFWSPPAEGLMWR